MFLSIYTAYQTRQIKESHTTQLSDGSRVFDAKVMNGMHQHSRRMVGQVFVTALGVAMVTVGILGMLGILPIGSIGSIALLSAGGYILADGLLAFILEKVRGPKAKRFHSIMGYSAHHMDNDVTLTYKYGKKTHTLHLHKENKKTFLKRAGWKITEVKAHPQEVFEEFWRGEEV